MHYNSIDIHIVDIHYHNFPNCFKLPEVFISLCETFVPKNILNATPILKSVRIQKNKKTYVVKMYLK